MCNISSVYVLDSARYLIAKGVYWECQFIIRLNKPWGPFHSISQITNNFTSWTFGHVSLLRVLELVGIMYLCPLYLLAKVSN